MSTVIADVSGVPINDNMDYAKKVNLDGEFSGGSSGSGGLVVTVSLDAETDTYTMDKTAKEIHDAMLTGLVTVLFTTVDGTLKVSYVIGYYDSGDGVFIDVCTQGSFPSSDDGYEAPTENGYPAFTADDGPN